MTDQALDASERPPAGHLVPDEGPWRVLLVDNRPERRALIRVVLGTDPPDGKTAVEITEASDVATAVGALRRQPVDAAVVEINIPVDVGLATITALRATHPSLVIVVCSFHVDPVTRLSAFAAGADGYLAKPVSRRELIAACRTPLSASQPAPPS
jgi:DNA-binding NarL/FixJ family response regulator